MVIVVLSSAADASCSSDEMGSRSVTVGRHVRAAGFVIPS
jgi:hypothetical protein